MKAGIYVDLQKFKLGKNAIAKNLPCIKGILKGLQIKQEVIGAFEDSRTKLL